MAESSDFDIRNNVKKCLEVPVVHTMVFGPNMWQYPDSVISGNRGSSHTWQQLIFIAQLVNVMYICDSPVLN